MNNRLGEALKALRKKKHLSQDELAKSLGYASRSSINKIELGHKKMSYQKLVLLQNKYHLAFNDLVVADNSLPHDKEMFPNPAIPSLCYIKSVVKNNPKIIVGDYTYYDDAIDGGDSFLRHVTHHYSFSTDRLIIGKYCAIARGVEFVMNAANHRMNAPSTYPFYIMGGKWGSAIAPVASELPNKGDTVIGNDVWIGQNVTILPGVHIGDGAIIGLNSTVASDIPAYTIAAGNPARVIKKRFDDELINLLEEFAWWNKPIQEVDSLLKIICNSDLTYVKSELKKRLRDHLTVRKATLKDFDTIIKIYVNARKFMVKNGNPTQWGKSWPPRDIIKESIKANETFVIIDKQKKIHGTFALTLKPEPDYKVIKDGHWLNDYPYVTLHRLASDFKVHGVASAMFEFAERFHLDVRGDTHQDNKIMQKQFKKHGFKHVGTIYINHQGTLSPRLAYQKTLK